MFVTTFLTISLLLLPSSALLSLRAPSLLDSLLDDLHYIETALRSLQSSVTRRRPAAGCLGKVDDDESRLAISLDVSNFKPEDVKMDLDGRVLKLEEKQESQDDSGYSVRSFTRAWALPEDVDVEQIKSSLTEDGHLRIEAPKINKPSITTKNIPIQKAITDK